MHRRYQHERAADRAVGVELVRETGTTGCGWPDLDAHQGARDPSILEPIAPATDADSYGISARSRDKQADLEVSQP